MISFNIGVSGVKTFIAKGLVLGVVDMNRDDMYMEMAFNIARYNGSIKGCYRKI